MSDVCRPADDRDSGLLLRLMREYYAFEGLEFDQHVQGAALDALLREPDQGRVFVVQSGDDQASGYVVLTFDFGLESGGREVFLDELFLREAYRGRGLGRAVLEFVVAVCRDWGIRAIHLGVEVRNLRAQEFYRRNGFAEPRWFLMTRSLRD